MTGRDPLDCFLDSPCDGRTDHHRNDNNGEHPPIPLADRGGQHARRQFRRWLSSVHATGIGGHTLFILHSSTHSFTMRSARFLAHWLASVD